MEKLEGTVASGTGEGAFFLGLEWVRAQIQSACGFEPFPGTLNVVLTTPASVLHWSEIRKGPGRPLAPPASDFCGGRCFPVLVAGELPGAVLVPDVTRYGEELLEVIAPVHLRSRLSLRDGDPINLTLLPAEND